MNERQAKEYLHPYWDEFLEWMQGQTVGTYPDGSINYYDYDVRMFFDMKWRENKNAMDNKRRIR